MKFEVFLRKDILSKFIVHKTSCDLLLPARTVAIIIKHNFEGHSLIIIRNKIINSIAFESHLSGTSPSRKGKTDIKFKKLMKICATPLFGTGKCLHSRSSMCPTIFTHMCNFR